MRNPNLDVLFSSVERNWETPENVFGFWDDQFNFTLDVCASEDNAKCDSYFDEEMDCLQQDWAPDVCWMNPPYGEPQHACKKKRDGSYSCKKKLCKERGHHSDVYVPGIGDFIKKAYEESLKGAVVVCLVPARTDTDWFHEYLLPHAEITFLRGRIAFIKPPALYTDEETGQCWVEKQGGDSAAFPNLVAVFRSKV